MPLFAAFFGALFSALGTFLAKIFAAKLALRIVAVTAMITLSSGLLASFNLYISPLVAAIFATSYGQFLGLAFPPVAGTMITLYLTAQSLVYAYKLKMQLIKTTADI